MRALGSLAAEVQAEARLCFSCWQRSLADGICSESQLDELHRRSTALNDWAFELTGLKAERRCEAGNLPGQPLAVSQAGVRIGHAFA